MKFRVQVPATSANMGPGFDCLGIALELYNVFTVEESSGFELRIEGEGKITLPANKSNLVYKAIDNVFTGLSRQVPPLNISCVNGIPLSRGLGSSAAAVVGGILAADKLLGNPLSPEEMLSLAVEMEGHGDNVAPALFGGCQLVLKDNGRFVHIALPVAAGISGVLFIPDFTISTAESRKILPPEIHRTDAVYNIGRAALLSFALSSGKFDCLKLATQDRLHQPARKALFPAMDRLFQAALEAGAAGAFLSGSGSAIMALSASEGKSDKIAAAIEKAARSENISGKSRIVSFASEGAKVTGFKS